MIDEQPIRWTLHDADKRAQHAAMHRDPWRWPKRALVAAIIAGLCVFAWDVYLTARADLAAFYETRGE